MWKELTACCAPSRPQAGTKLSGLHGSRQVCLMQIVLTIHQPSSDICERFDDLILLSCGRMLYCGPWGDADSYFASAGFE